MNRKPITPNPRHDAAVGRYLARHGGVRILIEAEEAPPPNVRRGRWEILRGNVPLEHTIVRKKP